MPVGLHMHGIIKNHPFTNIPQENWLHENINIKYEYKDGPTGIWTRGLRLARAALSQAELRAHIEHLIHDRFDLVSDCHQTKNDKYFFL